MIGQIQFLRFFLSLAIVLLHFPSNSILTNNHLILNSQICVDFFFILSGYILALKYSKNNLSKKDFIFFIKKRFFRLYPLHLIMLIVFVFLEIIKFYLVKYYNYKLNREFYTGLDFIINLFFLNGFVDSIFISFNEPSWSAAIEFYVNIIFIILIYLRTRIFYLFIICGIFLIYSSVLNISLVLTGRCFFSFFLGYYLYKISKNITWNSNSIILIIALIAIYLIATNKSDIKFYFVINPILFSIFFLLLIKLDNKSVIYRITNYKIFNFLGKISYSIYMTHLLTNTLFRNFCIVFLNIKKNEVNDLIFQTNPNIYIILLIFINILVSIFCYNFIEKKFFIKKYKYHN